VKPDHWAVTPSFLGAVSSTLGLATIRVGDTWRLSLGGDVVERDMAFVGSIGGPPAPPRTDPRRDMHVIRALYEEHETVFLTACGRVVEPAEIVARLVDVTCAACVS
jgi:hypothetical protein